MAVSAVSGASSASQAAYGLDFQSMLQIILTQLTYQDPLKPLDNFQFVSQLGQFAQLQQGQTQTDTITSLLNTQAANQATSLLGRTIDFENLNAPVTGTVQAVTFASGQPSLTVKASDGSTLTDISIANINQVR